MKLKKLFSAFTLTELLIALAILGALAGMAIPSLMEGLQKKQLTLQLKNTIAGIQQIAHNQMIAKNTKDLTLTDFNSPEKLLSEKNFPIVKSCEKAADCWTESYKKISGNTASTRYLEGDNRSIILKNGAIISYGLSNVASTGLPSDSDDRDIGIFRIDINGIDKPNMIGRDVFWFYISKKGKILNHSQVSGGDYNEAAAIAGCKAETFITACLTVIQENNWDMPY